MSKGKQIRTMFGDNFNLFNHECEVCIAESIPLVTVWQHLIMLRDR